MSARLVGVPLTAENVADAREVLRLLGVSS
jgi:hypothetical protein